jgi:hypothetical protein
VLTEEMSRIGRAYTTFLGEFPAKNGEIGLLPGGGAAQTISRRRRITFGLLMMLRLCEFGNLRNAACD